MNGHVRRGFTLTELMVIIGIVGLMVATVLPYFERIYAIQRKVACANNLEKIGQAYATRGTGGTKLAAFGWPQSLMSYVSGEGSVFICPEDDELAVDPLQTLKQVYIEVFTGAVNDYTTNEWNVPLDEGAESQWIWRLSQEQFEEFEAAPGHGKSYNYQGYVPGADPSTYWFVFEDQGWKPSGGDKDYWDLNLKIHYGLDGIEITTMPLPVGYNFNLCMGEGEEKVKLIEDVKHQASVTITLPGGTESGSYGINSVSLQISPGTNKLLVLDYERTYAKGSDYESEELDDWWGGEPEVFPLKDNGLPSFARHFDKVNVLFANGAVRLMDPGEIDIDKAEARRRYWNP